ncbi:GATA zinc finger-domain-containing protein [Cantharellus anzutake]|uniref:GATA zinc finger-domain-containing protein n=1 Tax=Cantharellus anzutake TaxID=1750568 RepID=UPI00190459B3|nr:GATA zinc finger-domain-containing protein [Cantharellus anzutake]KAF8340482.1 GATA zinc finger-domain-containing protein [Cantharellus anzutake]
MTVGQPPSEWFSRQDTSSKADRTRAERDMELIKRKRHALHDEEPETSPAPRPKKRGPRVTASSPGQCNSCGSRDTPEWRRGPEGPRTLCNACGLHYAKVMKEGGSFATEQ